MQDTLAAETSPSRSANAAASVEIVPVGDSYCLFRPDNHATALLNESGAEICRSIFDHAGIDRLERNGVNQVALANTHPPDDAGAIRSLLEQSSFLGPPIQFPTLSRAESTRIDSADRKAVNTYRIGNSTPVGLVCNTPKLSKLLQAALQPLRCRAPSDPSNTVIVERAGEGYDVRQNGTAVTHNADLSTARRVALQAMLRLLLPARKVATILHASTVSLNEKALILAGTTGSGKSTLAMSLIGHGATYLADDLTPLESCGNRVSCFPIAASIKSGSGPILEAKFPKLSDCDTYDIADRSVRYINPCNNTDPDSASVEIGALLFPKYVPDGALQMSSVSSEDALNRLLQFGN